MHQKDILVNGIESHYQEGPTGVHCPYQVLSSDCQPRQFRTWSVIEMGLDNPFPPGTLRVVRLLHTREPCPNQAMSLDATVLTWWWWPDMVFLPPASPLRRSYNRPCKCWLLNQIHSCFPPALLYLPSMLLHCPESVNQGAVQAPFSGQRYLRAIMSTALPTPLVQKEVRTLTITSYITWNSFSAPPSFQSLDWAQRLVLM